MEKKKQIEQIFLHTKALIWRNRFFRLLTKTFKIDKEENRETDNVVVNNLFELVNDLLNDMEETPGLCSEDLLNFSSLEGGHILEDQPEEKKREILRLQDTIKCTLSILQGVKELKCQMEDLKTDLQMRDQQNCTLQEELKVLMLNIAEGKVSVERLKLMAAFDEVRVSNLQEMLKINKEKYHEALQCIALNVKNNDDNLNDLQKKNLDLIKKIEQNQENNLEMETKFKQLEECLGSEKQKNENFLENIASYKQKIEENVALQVMFQFEREQYLQSFQITLQNMNKKLHECQKKSKHYFEEIRSLKVKVKNAEDLIDAYKNAKDKDGHKLNKAHIEFTAERTKNKKLVDRLECMKYECENLKVSYEASQNEIENLMLTNEKEKQSNKKQQEQSNVRYKLLQYKIRNKNNDNDI